MTDDIATQTIGTRDLCKMLDLTEARLSQLLAAGVLVKERRGHFMLLASVTGYLAFLRSRPVGGDGPASVESFRANRARLAALQGDLIEFQLSKERNEWARIEDVCATFGEVLAPVRAHVLALPARCAAHAPESERAAVFKGVSEAVRSMMEELSKEASERLGVEMEGEK